MLQSALPQPDQIASPPSCSGAACHEFYSKYQTLYGKYMDLYEKMAVVQSENAKLKEDVKCKLVTNSRETEYFKQKYELEAASLKALQSNLDQEAMASGKPVCLLCKGNRLALANQNKFFMAHFKENVAADAETRQRLFDTMQCLMQAHQEIGELRIQQVRSDDPFWQNREIAGLREKCDRAETEASMLRKTADKLRATMAVLKEKNAGLKKEVENKDAQIRVLQVSLECTDDNYQTLLQQQEEADGALYGWTDAPSAEAGRNKRTRFA